MMKINKITLLHLFQFFLICALFISLYMLIVHAYQRKYTEISCWRFPMLLAILLESYLI
jgi:hypothetical protein